MISGEEMGSRMAVILYVCCEKVLIEVLLGVQPRRCVVNHLARASPSTSETARGVGWLSDDCYKQIAEDRMRR